MIDNELIEHARNADLLQYLQSRGYRLIKSSHEYRLEDHDSLVISNNKWNWFSRDMGGNTLDFLIKYEGMEFTEAVKVLTNQEYTPLPIDPVRQRHIDQSIGIKSSENNTPLVLPPKNKDFHRVFAYLNKTRKIDREIIAEMMQQGKLYESDRHNVVFVGKDKEGCIRFASERGTLSIVSYRRDCPGSDKAYSFYIEGESNTLFVYESPIDLLSYATILKINNQDYLQDHRISLSGLSDAALMKYLEENAQIKNVVLCLDNDTWGHAATAKLMKLLKEKGYQVKEEFSKSKDYNEDLVALIKPKTLEMLL